MLKVGLPTADVHASVFACVDAVSLKLIVDKVTLVIVPIRTNQLARAASFSFPPHANVDTSSLRVPAASMAMAQLTEPLTFVD